MSVDEEAPVTAFMLEPGDAIFIEGEEADYRVEVDFDPEVAPPWEGVSDFVPVLLFEGTRDVSVRQVGSDEAGNLKAGGLDMVPVETVLEHREALLEWAGASRKEARECARLTGASVAGESPAGRRR